MPDLTPGYIKPSPLHDAVHKVICEATEPMSAPMVLSKIRENDPNAFPYVSWLDVHETLGELYGEPNPR